MVIITRPKRDIITVGLAKLPRSITVGAPLLSPITIPEFAKPIIATKSPMPAEIAFSDCTV